MAQKTIDVKPAPAVSSGFLPVPDQGGESMSPRTYQARADVERTRAELGGTLEAIQSRITPQTVRAQVTETFDTAKDAVMERISVAEETIKAHVGEQIQEAKDKVRNATIGRVENMVHRAGDTIDEARFTLTDTVRRNPLPAAMVGLGLAWIAMNGRRQPGFARRSTSYRGYDLYGDPVSLGTEREGILADTKERARDAIDDVQDTARNVSGRVQEAAHNVSERVQESAGEIAHRAEAIADRTRDQAQWAEQRIERSFVDNPIAFGALSLAAGAAFAMLLPKSRREDRLMGTARDRFVDKAQSTASEAIHKVEDVAKQAVSSAASQASLQPSSG